MRENAMEPDRGLLSRAYHQLDPCIKTAFLSALIACFATHSFMFTNVLVNHDVLGRFYGNMDYSLSGRWLLQAVTGISTSLDMPWVSGVLSSLYLSLSAALITSLFRVRNIGFAAAIGAMMAMFPAVFAIFVFIYTADEYFLSLLLCCLAIWIARRWKWGFALGAVLLAMSAGIYQAFMAFAAGVLILALLMDALGESRVNLKTFLWRAGCYLIMLAGAFGLYAAVLQASLHGAVAVGRYSYVGFNGIAQEGLPRLLALVGGAYQSCYAFFFVDSAQYSTLIPALCALLAGISLITLGAGVWLRKTYCQPWRILFSLLLLVVLPIGAGCMYIISPQGAFPRMLYGLLCFLLLPVLALSDAGFLVPKAGGLKVYRVVSLLTLITLLPINHSYFLLANRCYLREQLIYEHTYAYTVKLSARIESTEGYEPGMRILFLGAFNRNENRPYMLDGEDSFPIADADIPSAKYLIGMSSYRYFAPIFLGESLGAYDEITPDETEEIKALYESELSEMSPYPAANSIQVFDDVVVVLLENLYGDEE